MWKYDGWSSEFKYGLVSPHADIGPEAETQAMLAHLPATVHGARVGFSPMHPGGTIDEKIAHDPVLEFTDPHVIDRCVDSLSSSPLDAIGLAFTSSSFKMGPAGEQELLARLATVSHGIRLQTTCSAATSAFRHLELERIAVIAPSWFDDQLCGEGEAYLRDNDIDVVSVTASGPEGGPLAITPQATADAVTKIVERTRSSSPATGSAPSGPWAPSNVSSGRAGWRAGRPSSQRARNTYSWASSCLTTTSPAGTPCPSWPSSHTGRDV